MDVEALDYDEGSPQHERVVRRLARSHGWRVERTTRSVWLTRWGRKRPRLRFRDLSAAHLFLAFEEVA